MAARLERRPQPAYMYVDRTLLDEHMIAPHLIEQLGARMYALRMRHQEMEQTKLRGPEAQRLAIGLHPVGGRIEAQPSQLDRILSSTGSSVV